MLTICKDKKICIKQKETLSILLIFSGKLCTIGIFSYLCTAFWSTSIWKSPLQGVRLILCDGELRQFIHYQT